MTALEAVFSAALLVVAYAYVGYAVVVYGLVRLKRALHPTSGTVARATEPGVALIVPAFNEADCIAGKIANCQALDYPRDKLQIVIVTDGSTDGTPEIAWRFTGIEVRHGPERLGKAAAINGAVAHVNTPIIVLSDANTMLNRDAIRKLTRHYADPGVGAVAGEKRIRSRESAAAVGEGLYWRYESLLKRLDSELWTVVGAAGELMSFRRELFVPLEEDSILDDFVLSLRIAARGYRVAYEPGAYAVEAASASVGEELKRKIRIAAGGWQSMVRLRSLLNPRSHPALFFQYVSHRVLRWSLVPLCLLLLVPANVAVALGDGPRVGWYRLLLWGQIVFYTLALMGYMGDRRGHHVKLLFPPYYFVITNYAVVRGFARFLAGRQPARWDRARRALLLLPLLAGGATADAAPAPVGPTDARDSRVVVRGVMYSLTRESSEVLVELGSVVRYTTGLSDGGGFYIDLFNTTLDPAATSASVSRTDPLVRDVRLRQRMSVAAVTRVEIDLRMPVLPEVWIASDPPRLVARWSRVTADELARERSRIPGMRAAPSATNLQVRLNAIHNDNFFQSPEGRPKQTVWGRGVDARWLTPVNSRGKVRLYGDADVIESPGFAPTFGVGAGLRRDLRTTAFDANVGYLWNRPSTMVGDEFDRADMLHLQGEYRLRPHGPIQIIGQARYRREQYERAARKKNQVFDVGPIARYRLFGYALTPEAGFVIAGRAGRDPNNAYGEHTLVVGTTSSLLGSRVYLGARYRQGLRHYSTDDHTQSNFGRTDRRRQLSFTLALALWRELYWTAYYDRERGFSGRDSGNFTTRFLSMGLAAQF